MVALVSWGRSWNGLLFERRSPSWSESCSGIMDLARTPSSLGTEINMMKHQIKVGLAPQVSLLTRPTAADCSWWSCRDSERGRRNRVNNTTQEHLGTKIIWLSYFQIVLAEVLASIHAVQIWYEFSRGHGLPDVLMTQKHYSHKDGRRLKSLGSYWYLFLWLWETHLSMQVSVKQHHGTREREHGSGGGEHVRIALLETSGEVLQDSLTLLSLTGQNHLLQKWPKNQEGLKSDSWRISSVCAQSLETRSLPERLLQTLVGEVKELEVLFPGGTTELVAVKRNSKWAHLVETQIVAWHLINAM